jgi:hypothetical protein
MIVEQNNDRLSIQYPSYAGILGSLFFIAVGAFLWLEIGANNVLVALLALFNLSFGVFLLFRRPDIITFDKASGKFIIQHRTFFSKREEIYPLSDIKAVLLLRKVVEITPPSWDASVPTTTISYCVSLRIQERDVNDDWKYKRITITSNSSSEKSLIIAEVVASFLGITFRNESKGKE